MIFALRRAGVRPLARGREAGRPSLAARHRKRARGHLWGPALLTGSLLAFTLPEGCRKGEELICNFDGMSLWCACPEHPVPTHEMPVKEGAAPGSQGGAAGGGAKGGGGSSGGGGDSGGGNGSGGGVVGPGGVSVGVGGGANVHVGVGGGKR